MLKNYTREELYREISSSMELKNYKLKKYFLPVILICLILFGSCLVPKEYRYFLIPIYIDIFIASWLMLISNISKIMYKQFYMIQSFIPPKGFVAMTLGFLVFVKKKPTLKIINHELIHLYQVIGCYGITIFLILYIIDYIYKWIVIGDRKAAYYLIAFEHEAYTMEYAGKDYLKIIGHEYLNIWQQNLFKIPENIKILINKNR